MRSFSGSVDTFIDYCKISSGLYVFTCQSKGWYGFLIKCFVVDHNLFVSIVLSERSKVLLLSFSCFNLQVLESGRKLKSRRWSDMYPVYSCISTASPAEWAVVTYVAPLWQAEKLCGSVELGLGPDAPLLVKYDLESGENGHMKFYLAPKIDE